MRSWRFGGTRNKRKLLFLALLGLSLAGPVSVVVACDRSPVFSGCTGENIGTAGSSLTIVFIGNPESFDPPTFGASINDAASLGIPVDEAGCVRYRTVSGSVCANDVALGHHF